MKKDIHPAYHDKVKVTCACGFTFETGSTAKEIKVELCSACHPFYTGKQKLVDSARRVEKFEAKLKAGKDIDAGGKKQRRAKRDAKKKEKEVVVKTKDIKRISQVKFNKK